MALNINPANKPVVKAHASLLQRCKEILRITGNLEKQVGRNLEQSLSMRDRAKQFTTTEDALHEAASIVFDLKVSISEIVTATNEEYQPIAEGSKAKADLCTASPRLRTPRLSGDILSLCRVLDYLLGLKVETIKNNDQDVNLKSLNDGLKNLLLMTYITKMRFSYGSASLEEPVKALNLFAKDFGLLTKDDLENLHLNLPGSLIDKLVPSLKDDSPNINLLANKAALEIVDHTDKLAAKGKIRTPDDRRILESGQENKKTGTLKRRTEKQRIEDQELFASRWELIDLIMSKEGVELKDKFLALTLSLTAIHAMANIENVYDTGEVRIINPPSIKYIEAIPKIQITDQKPAS